jgi:hypothetical protein
MRTVMHGLLLLTMTAGIALAASPGGRAGGLLLDDFGGDDDRSLFGTRWRSFTDAVMGGDSKARVTREEIDGRRCLRLRGTVSLDNQGGFIQVALPLDRGDAPLDATSFGGIALVVRTNGEPGYYVHLRTAGTVHPWEHYRAELPAGEAWTEVRIPFADFRPVGLRRELDTSGLTRIGIVAGRRSFEADIAVARVSLYRSPELVTRGPDTPEPEQL